MIVAVVSADHVVTVRDVVMVGTVIVGVAFGLAVVVGLLAMMAKGWDH